MRESTKIRLLENLVHRLPSRSSVCLLSIYFPPKGTRRSRGRTRRRTRARRGTWGRIRRTFKTAPTASPCVPRTNSYSSLGKIICCAPISCLPTPSTEFLHHLNLDNKQIFYVYSVIFSELDITSQAYPPSSLHFLILHFLEFSPEILLHFLIPGLLG